MPLVKRNLNQFKKVYPGIRKTPKYENLITIDENLTLEIGTVVVKDSSTATFNFINTYATTPTVTASISNTGGGNMTDVNIYIHAISSTSVTINCSEAVDNATINLIIISKSS